MTAPSYLASLNERQQVTFPIGGPGQPAAVYPGTIASATWRMQVRSSATAIGTLFLDSQVGGTWTYVGGAAPAVTFQWPTSAAALIPPGSAAFDVLFILPGADPELATAGSVAFTRGVTQAGVSGSPAAPIGADDTWTLVGAPVAPISPSLASAIAATNSNAAAAQAAETAAAASATAASGSATAAASSATSASASAATATTEAGDAAASAAAAVSLLASGIVATVGALAALSPSLGAVVLTQNARYGSFVWFAGNFETSVANDPGQGIYVAWSSDSAPGASGAWVRQWSGDPNGAFWGVANDGVITPATGQISLPTNPSAAQTVTIGTTVITFVASGATGNQVNIGASAAASVAALLTFLQASTDGQVLQCSYALDATVTKIDVAYGVTGQNLGNGFVLATTATGGSAANLSGGATAGTDNGQALAYIGAYGRYVASLTGGFTIKFNAGVYLWDGETAYGWTWNLGKSQFLIQGTTWFNTNNSGDGNYQYAWHPPCSSGYENYTINSTVKGANTVTLATAANASVFVVGEMVMISGMDVQTLGFPSSPQFFEYAFILSINPATGLITLKSALRYEYLATWPDYNLNGLPNAIGAARITKCSYYSGSSISPGGGVPSVAFIDFNIDMELVGPCNMYGCIGTGYQTWGGRKITTRKWTGPGDSSSSAYEVEHWDFVPTTSSETDKRIHSLTFHNLQINDGSYNLQSANNFIKLYGGKIDTLLSGTTKNFYAESVDIGSLTVSAGLAYGYQSETTFKNCRIFNYMLPAPSGVGYTSPFWDCVSDADKRTVDGTIITIIAGPYGTATIRATIASLGYPGFPSIPAGAQIIFPAVTTGSVYTIFPGDLGVCRVFNMRQDATYIYIDTDWPFTSLPSWSAGFFFPIHLYNVTFEQCMGCDYVKGFSLAHDLGLKYYNVKRFFFDSNQSPNGYYLADQTGSIVEIDVNVVKPGTGSATLSLTWSYTFNSATFAADAIPGLVVGIDGTTAGSRVLTQLAATTTLLGSDSIKVAGGAPATALPQNRLITGAVVWNYPAGSGFPPEIEVIIKYSHGQARTSIEIQGGSGPSTVFNATGVIAI